MGRKVKASEFEKIHGIYMACGDDMEKDAFCAKWKAGDLRGLLEKVAYERKMSEGAYYLAMKTVKSLMEEQEAANRELAEFLLGKAAAHQDSDLRNEAVRLIGVRNAILTTLRMGLPLCEEDMDYIGTNLK